LKVLAGTYRPSRDNKDAPTPEVGVPLAPEWLDDRGVQAWAELVAQVEPTKVMTHADRSALGLAADALAEYVAARAVIRETGTSYAKRSRGRTAIQRPRPEVAIASAARRDVFRMLESFGLTPASRSRVTVDPKQKKAEEDDEWARIAGWTNPRRR
jgi:P27 family predicted phage terminase small subunit